MPRKKTAETIRQEVARQIDQLLRVIFQERHKTGGLDLEATEMAMRSALHHAGAIETVEEFGMRIHLEAWKGGWSRAKKKSRDGGRSRMDLESGRSILSRPDPDCRSVSRSPAPLGTGPQATPQRREHSEPLELDNCKINKLVTYLRSTQTPSVELAENFGPRRSTFAGTRGACGIPTSAANLFVGTGVIEAGIGSRCKQPGMFWIVRGANAILALRCCQFNGEVESYWEARRA